MNQSFKWVNVNIASAVYMSVFKTSRRCRFDAETT